MIFNSLPGALHADSVDVKLGVSQLSFFLDGWKRFVSERNFSGRSASMSDQLGHCSFKSAFYKPCEERIFLPFYVVQPVLIPTATLESVGTFGHPDRSQVKIYDPQPNICLMLNSGQMSLFFPCEVIVC